MDPGVAGTLGSAEAKARECDASEDVMVVPCRAVRTLERAERAKDIDGSIVSSGRIEECATTNSQQPLAPTSVTLARTIVTRLPLRHASPHPSG